MSVKKLIQKPKQHNMPAMTGHIVIIGGTSGIGLALAKHCLARGLQVTVVGSTQKKVQAVQNTIANTTAPNITAICADITDAKKRQQLFERLESEEFNLLVYSAGWYLNERVQQLNSEDSKRMLAVNLTAFQAVFAWASGYLETQRQQRNNSHQVYGMVAISSIAGLVTYPYASLYARCKAAMISSCYAYRQALQPLGIQVNCIASSYVDTQTLRDYNAGDASHKPFIISETQAAEAIYSAIEKNQVLAVFPWQMRYLTKVLKLIPKRILSPLMKGKLDK